MSSNRRIEYNTINSLVKAASYAVRGPIVARSMEISKQLALKDKKLPFDSVISCNIGNPHALQQKSLSFIRDVLSLVLNPSLADRATFPDDVKARAKKYLSSIPDIGAYSESQGILTVREEVCQFLEKRDGIPGDPANVFLTNGASEGVRLCMQTILRTPDSGFRDGILTPIPQYPLYSALTTLLQGNLIPYYLDESKGWECTFESLAAALLHSEKNGITARALVIINPGNPTGQILNKSSIQDIISWCKKENILLLADEVYQENIWKRNSEFISFRKVAYEMDAFSGPNALQLISFHSISKGFLGECGLRGGYFEVLGVPLEVRQEILKLSSISLCSNTLGQIATGIMVNPPSIGEPSFDTYKNEKDEILSSLQRRAERLSNALNTLEGVSCNTIDGAMYAFPTITLPEKAILEAQSRKIEPDTMYAMDLLESTGIVVVPGSGFGQVSGTYHFRTTILPPEDKIENVIARLKVFHTKFLSTYA